MGSKSFISSQANWQSKYPEQEKMYKTWGKYYKNNNKQIKKKTEGRSQNHFQTRATGISLRFSFTPQFPQPIDFVKMTPTCSSWPGGNWRIADARDNQSSGGKKEPFRCICPYFSMHPIAFSSWQKHFISFNF